MCLGFKIAPLLEFTVGYSEIPFSPHEDVRNFLQRGKSSFDTTVSYSL